MSGYIGTQPVPQATQTRDSFTATSGQTSFATGGYTPNFLDVYLNGVKLASADYTATNGSDVVLASGAATGDILEVVAFTTFTPASIPDGTPSIDDNGTGTALTIDSSGNLLVSKTSGPNYNAVGIDLTTLGEGQFTVSSNPVLTLNRQVSDGDIAIFRKDGSAVGSIGVVNANNMYLAGSASNHAGVQFGTQNVTPYNNGSQSDGAVDLGAYNLRWKDLYLSGGVYLGGTGAANKLDDYEEGYGVSAFTTTGGSVTINSNFNRIFYTKVGRQVLLSGRISVASVSSPTGLLQITIPFTCANLDHDPSAAVYLAVNGIASGDIGDFWAEIPEGGNTINVYRTGSNNVSNSAAGFMVSGSDIRILASYIAA